MELLKTIFKIFKLLFLWICIISILVIINYSSIGKYENRLLTLGLLLFLLLGQFIGKGTHVVQQPYLSQNYNENWTDIQDKLVAMKVASIHKSMANLGDNNNINTDMINKKTDNSLVEMTGPYSNKVLSQYNCNSMVYQGTSNPLLNDMTQTRTKSYDCPEEFAFDGSGKVHDCKDISKPHTSRNNEDSLLMFSCNTCSPKCCPSNYTCPGGCVCITPEQKKIIKNRGTNNVRLEPENMMS